MVRRTWVGVVAAVALLLVPIWIGEYGALVLATGAITVVAALGLHVLTHWAGQISLGHVAFVAIGSFVTADMATRANLPWWLAAGIGILVTVLTTVLIGLPALRIRGFYLAIVTLAFGLAADRWLFRQTWLSGGSSGVKVSAPTLFGVQLGSSRSLYVLVVAVTIAMIVLARAIGRSKAGRAFLAMRADEEVAAAWGINVPVYKLLAFATAGGFAAVAGVLKAYSLGIVGPQTFPVGLSIQYVAIVVIGGAGGVWGTAVAAAFFGVLPALESGLGRYSSVTGAIGILLVITRYPGGLNEVGERGARMLAKAVNRAKNRRVAQIKLTS